MGQRGKYSLEKSSMFYLLVQKNIKVLKIMDTKIQDQSVVRKFLLIILRS